MSRRRRFRLIDVVLSVICVVLVAEAIAPAAAIGNSQLFWWLLLILTFLLPYGLVVSELGTTYSQDEGGLYDWVRRAYGDRWSSRVAWWYWINFPLWMASLAVLFPVTITAVTGRDTGPLLGLAVELAFIWTVVVISLSRASDSIWIMNLAAVLKVGIALLVGGLGVYHALTSGPANGLSPDTFLPTLETGSLTYLSIILFNFMGFEVVATYASDMTSPRTQIPRAVVTGGIVIAMIYIVSSFGVGAAVPASRLSLDSGIVDAVTIMTGQGSVAVALVAVVFLATLVGNMISWSFGVNYVAACAAKDHNLPQAFASVTRRSRMPKGVSVGNGVVASAMVVLLPVAQRLGAGNIFWVLFSVGVVFLLLSYIPVFPAFLRLRAQDQETERAYQVPGGRVVRQVVAWVPVVLILLAVAATIVPLDGSESEMSKLPMLVTVLVLATAGEGVRVLSSRRRPRAYQGMARDGPPAAREGLGIEGG